MNYGQIRKYDIANGPGIRTSIFVTGCTINCKNCFNMDYQDPKYGLRWTDDNTAEIITYLNSKEVSGLSILGGEPFDNAHDLEPILKIIRINTNKDIWIYSGYTFEKILTDKVKRNLLNQVDVLVDGPFIEEMKDLKLKFRGSKNQRIIDVKKSLENNKVMILNGYE